MLPGIDAIIDDLIEREGREYVDHPSDRGGPSKFGITMPALARCRGRAVTIEDMKALEEAEARNIYLNHYVTSVQFHRIHDPYLRALMVDAGVHHGPQRAIRWLQQAAGVTDDGVLGPVTEVAVNSADPIRLYQAVLARRIKFIGRIISHDLKLAEAKDAGFRLQAENALGWLNRIAGFVET